MSIIINVTVGEQKDKSINSCTFQDHTKNVVEQMQAEYSQISKTPKIETKCHELPEKKTCSSSNEHKSDLLQASQQ